MMEAACASKLPRIQKKNQLHLNMEADPQTREADNTLQGIT
jgi:hypothetical protein